MSGTSDIPGGPGTPAVSPLKQGYRVDPYTGGVRVDGDMAAARMLRTLAFVGVGARLFAIYASANRILVSRSLSRALDSNGELDLTRREDAYSLYSRARDADSLVTYAFVAAIVMFALYLIALIRVGVRAKRGNVVAKSIAANRALRVAQGLYFLAAMGAVGVMNLFKPPADALPRIRLNDLIGQDGGNIGLQVVVIAFLLLVGLAVNREIAAAYTDTRNLYRQSPAASAGS